jgi:molecular chaperone GrpE (heat shock protein)
MAGVFDLLGVRRELKGRVDEILKCGNSWEKTAKELIVSLNRFEANIKTTKKLSANTKELAKGFGELNKTLSKVAEKL